MEILKCNADFSKVYYVEIKGNLHQCKLLCTESSNRYPVYVLDVAQIGVVRIESNRQHHFDKWYRTSKIPSILYDSVESYRNRKPIIDDYGSTGNCYNSSFIMPLFKRCSVCNCGGSVYTWKWDGCKAVKHIVNMSKVTWYWDAEGFHCILNELEGFYKTQHDCEVNNELSVVTF